MDIKSENSRIKRDIYPSLLAHLEKQEITMLVGPRQVGKTTLMRALEEDSKSLRKKTLFLSLDFDEHKPFFATQRDMIQKLELEFGSAPGVVFIDEVQRKENAGLFLKGIFDHKLPYKFVVSGSGSIELKEKIHESLAGRKLMYEIVPVSFMEFVNWKTGYRYADRIQDFFSVESARTQEYLVDYLRFGGYPRVILEDTLEMKSRTIAEIYSSYLEKDIAYLLKVEKTDAFRVLVEILSSQIGNLLNTSELASTVGISHATVKQYLWYLEKTYIIDRVTPYYRNTRKEVTKAPTVYFCDLGLRNYVRGTFGQISQPDEMGFLFQNAAFAVLKQTALKQGARVHFWRTTDKAEVDFIIEGREPVPIEVKWREFREPKIERSLRSFIGKYNPSRALVVTKGFRGEMKAGKTAIRFIPFWELAVSHDLFS